MTMQMTTGGKRFGKGLRGTALLVALFFTWTLAGGATAAHAAKLSANQSKQRGNEAQPPSAEERLEGLVREVEGELNAPVGDDKARRQKLKTKRGEIDTVDQEIRRELVATRKKLKEAKLPAEILQRHEAFVRHYESNVSELKAELTEIETARTPAVAEAAREKLRQHRERTKAPSRHQKLDPNNLPHRSAEPTKQQPRLKKEEFERVYGKDLASLPRTVRVATVGDLTGLLSPNTAAPINYGQPSLDDLAFTVDAPLTSAIEAKAAELGHDPLKIYNWVRNTIEFVPTGGSIQGAQLTMETRQGNAYDTASLLIALLRASGVHARYVLGTVELPIDKIQNWAGGFTDPMAALDFMSSGGIPTTALTEGGKVTKARFEHVWVEAWIDYLPSRGARHQDGQGDTWIPLDASFKQYAYTQGLDLQTAVPFDAQSFVDQLKATATINEAQGYATGVNGQLVQQALSDYQSRVEAYIAQQHPNATVGDVLGKKEIVVKDYPYLLGTLPYKTAVRGGAYALLPASLRHTLSFSVAKSGFDETPLTFKQSLPELAGKKITLSYTPATPADEAVINSYLPQPHPDGTPIQPEELPTSLPAYLINVKPELRIDGQVVATGSPLTLGSSETFVMNFFDPSSGTSPVSNSIIAGSYQAVGLNLGQISPEQVQKLKNNIKNAIDRLMSGNGNIITKEEVFGDYLYGTVIMYHADLDVEKKIARSIFGVSSVTLPSEAIFSIRLNVGYVFEIPIKVSIVGLNIDADRLLETVMANDGTKSKSIEYMKDTGLTSSKLEHEVPEKLFSSYKNILSGISSVKAIKLANDSLIPIYEIDKNNFSNIYPNLNINNSVKEEIKAAVFNGKSVIVPRDNIVSNGWSGCGYIIYDPSTGAGCYKISGGTSGGDITLDGSSGGSGWGGLLKNTLVLIILHDLSISAAAGGAGLMILAAFYDGKDLQSATGYFEFIDVDTNKIIIEKKVDKLLATIVDYAIDLAKEIEIGKVGEIAKIIEKVKDGDGSDLHLIYTLLSEVINSFNKILKQN